MARLANLEQQAALALEDSTMHLTRGAWPEAMSSVRRAQGIVTGGGSPVLVQQIAQRRAELELVARLEEVRLIRPSVREEERFDDQDVAQARTPESRQSGNGDAELASAIQDDAPTYAAVFRESCAAVC